jgi:phage-related protein
MATLEFPDHLLGTSSETYEPMQLEKEPKVMESKFGDGYSQRVADGINNNLQTWQISFTKRSGADVDAIYDFLEARGGVESFEWTPRGEQTPRNFICKKWTRRFDHYDVVQAISFSLEEVPA